MSDDYDVEPIPGLPALPPKGETILWQGKPDWHSFAMSALHVRMVFAWFGLIGAFRLASAWHDGALTSLVWTQIAFLALLSLIAAALLCAFAYAVARTTVYTVTNRRVVMRFGVALPMTVNLPYSQIDGASLPRIYWRIIIPSLRPVFFSTLMVLSHLAIKSFDLVMALTAGGPGFATDLPATFMYTMAFSRGQIGLGAASATIMLATVAAIVVPYLYSELRARK